jgi:hypothetical protein
MNKKNIIRLTESELKNIITESVKNILSEGQGFDFLKSTYDDMKSDEDYSLSDFKNFIQNDMDGIKNFIKTGDFSPQDYQEAGDYYDPNDPALSWPGSTKEGKPLKKINKTPYGKIGRAAGSVGAMGIAGMKALGNSIRKKL